MPIQLKELYGTFSSSTEVHDMPIAITRPAYGMYLLRDLMRSVNFILVKGVPLINMIILIIILGQLRRGR